VDFGLWRYFSLLGHRMTVADRKSIRTLSKGWIGRAGISTEPCSVLRPLLDAVALARSGARGFDISRVHGRVKRRTKYKHLLTG
jgi:hypothetical protein